MSKAEEAALKAYPIQKPRSLFGFSLEYSHILHRREAFAEGYEQAEKDLALTWQDMETIAKIIHNLVFTITADEPVENIYEEVLKRFSEKRNAMEEEQ